MNATKSFCVIFAAVLGGCATMTDTRTPTMESFEALRKAPMVPLVRNVTSFREGLRCMDQLFVQYGTSSSLMVEDLLDKTQKSPAGTTEMFLGAMAQMTRRSHAIRTVAFSDDAKNLASFMRHAGRMDAFQAANIPTYAVRGAISQFDDNLARKTLDEGVSLGPIGKLVLGAGAARSSSVSMIGLDLVLLQSRDFSLVPGVSTQNAAALLQEGDGHDVEATFSKLGVTFMSSLGKSDSKGVALRNLVELGAIELIGRMTRTPYWRCLDVPASNAGVMNEIEDWYESMSTVEKTQFFLQQFRAIGLLPSTDAPVNPETFKLAFRAYSEALGFHNTKTISLQLFRAHLAADPDEVGPKAIAIYERDKRIVLQLQSDPTSPRGTIPFTLTTNRLAFVSCFVRDKHDGRVRRVFPFDSRRSSQMRAGQVIALEQSGGVAPPRPGTMQTLACYASQDNRRRSAAKVLASLPNAAILDAAGQRKIESRLAASLKLMDLVTARF